MVNHITNNENKGFIDKPKNEIKVILNNEFFLQNTLLRLQLEPSLQKNVKKFIDAFELDINDPNYISTSEEIVKQIIKDLKERKKNKTRFSILYCLREMDFLSFDQFERLLNCNSKLLTEILKELKEKDLIKECADLNPKTKKFNEILRSNGETKKRKFYELNKHHIAIKDHIQSIDLYVNQQLKEEIYQEKTFLKTATLNYEEELKLKNKKAELKKKKSLTKLQKIIDALGDLYLNNRRILKPAELIEHLSFYLGLIKPKSWKGYRDQYGVYSGFSWEAYLMKQGFIKEFNKNDEFYIQITYKVMTTDLMKPENTSNQIKRENPKQIETDETKLIDQEIEEELDLIRTAKPEKP